MIVLFMMIPNDSFIYDVIQWQFYLWCYTMTVLFMMLYNDSFIYDVIQW
jgi:hypothetical protein